MQQQMTEWLKNKESGRIFVELHETLNTSLKFCGKHTHTEPE